jgi:hypothetical protein
MLKWLFSAIVIVSSCAVLAAPLSFGPMFDKTNITPVAQVLAHGVVQAMSMDLTASIKYMAHLAHEQGEAFDPASVTEAITLYQLVPTSVEIAQ